MIHFNPLATRRHCLFILLFICLTAWSLFTANPSHAQTSDVSTKDDSIFQLRVKQARSARLGHLPIGERVAAVGKLFLGTEYVAGTLDLDSAAETLVVNLQVLDCVTFYENTLAFARLLNTNPTIARYRNELRWLRYRGGINVGFHSRLNYTTDYFRNAEQKGILKNVTSLVGGKYARRDTGKIDFMSEHRSLYKQISRNDAELSAIKQTEEDLNALHGFIFIPKADIERIESGIRTGDILGITTDLAGLDCTHTGIAIRLKDGRIHFMHASSLKHHVIISSDPLADYLTESARQTGIIVMRPLEVKNDPAITTTRNLN